VCPQSQTSYLSAWLRLGMRADTPYFGCHNHLRVEGGPPALFRMPAVPRGMLSVDPIVILGRKELLVSPYPRRPSSVHVHLVIRVHGMASDPMSGETASSADIRETIVRRIRPSHLVLTGTRMSDGY
jgi:hypothetical protein